MTPHRDDAEPQDLSPDEKAAVEGLIRVLCRTTADESGDLNCQDVRAVIVDAIVNRYILRVDFLDNTVDIPSSSRHDTLTTGLKTDLTETRSRVRRQKIEKEKSMNYNPPRPRIQDRSTLSAPPVSASFKIAVAAGFALLAVVVGHALTDSDTLGVLTTSRSVSSPGAGIMLR